MSLTSMTELMVNKEMLISLVKARPVLWGRNRDKGRRKIAWEEIFHILRDDFDQLDETEKLEFSKYVIRTWSQLRDCWVRSLNDRKKGKATRPYIYHRQLKFLKQVIDHEYLASDTEDEPMKRTTAAVQKTDIKSGQKNEIPFKRKITNDQLLAARIPDVQEYDRHFAFFKSIHPSLSSFNDDQTLQFQSGVISLLQGIKNGEGYDAWPRPSSSHWQSHMLYKPPPQTSPFQSETSEDPFQETKFDVNEDSK